MSYFYSPLSNVSISSPQDGDTLIYNAATGLWENGGGGGGTAIPSQLQLFSAGTAETFNRLEGVRTSRAYANGTTYLTALTPNEDVTVSNISVFVGTGGSTFTLVRLGLYTFDGTDYTLVAQTADEKANFTSNNSFVTAAFDTAGGFPASYNLTAGTLYYVGIIQVASTRAQIVGPTTPSTVAAYEDLINSGTPKLCRDFGGQTDLAATYAEASAGNSVIMAYARLS